jgi:glycosyltransferase involved in cell wall biosynthesis
VRIAAAVCSYPPYRGGIGNAAARHARALVEAGHEVTVLCPAQDGRPARETRDGVAIRRLPALLRHGVSALVPTIAAHVRRADALLLHYPFYGGAEAAVAAARAARVPYAAFFHMDVPADGLRGAFVRGYDRTLAPLILRGAGRVLVSSLDYADDSTVGRLGLGTLSELPYGVDTREFRPGPAEPEVLRGLGLDPAVPVVLFVGGMDAGHAFKGVPVLLEAMEGIPADEARLALVGDGGLRPGFEEQARRRGVDAVWAGGASDDVLRALYRAAAVTVLPSVTREEAFGIVLIESMASGTPVVASDLPGVRTVPDEETGVLVPPRDAAGLRHAIRSVIGDRARLARMSAAARERAVARYSRERERADLDAVMTAVAGR